MGTYTKLQHGDTQFVMKCYQQAIMINPNDADAYYNLGLALSEVGQHDEALMQYENAIQRDPRCAAAYNNMGVIWKERENLQNALWYYGRALEANPNFSQALTNVGVVCNILGRPTEAHMYLLRAVEVAPNYPEAYNNLGVHFRDLGKVRESIEMYDRCVKLDRNSKNAWQNKLLVMNYLDEHDVEDFPDMPDSFAEHTAWADHFVKELPHLPYTTWPLADSARGRLRIGYISPDLFTHSVSYFVHCVLQYHNSSHVEVFVYQAANRTDDKTRYFQSLVPPTHWRNISGKPADEVVRQIREVDGVQVLVDLAGHTASNRLDVMALRAAPVQVTWIGYPNTTGLGSIDYRITDAVADPPDTRQRYSEELLRLPGCFLCYTPPSNAPEPSGTPPCLREKLTAANEPANMNFVNGSTIDPTAIPYGPNLTEAAPSFQAGHTLPCRALSHEITTNPDKLPADIVAGPGAMGTSDPHVGITCGSEVPSKEAVGPGLGDGQGCVTFGSFNHYVKVTTRTRRLWCDILRRVPNSRLILKSKPFAFPDTCETTLRTFESQGIDRSRLKLLPLVESSVEHLRSYEQMDIALDPFPYGGTTTTCETLLMSVPVLVLRGSTHVQNVGASLLTTVGHPELVANSEAEYVEKAVALANDRSLLSTYHKSLRAEVLRSPLCDGPAFVCKLESALWEKYVLYWCGSRSPSVHRPQKHQAELTSPKDNEELQHPDGQEPPVLSAATTGAVVPKATTVGPEEPIAVAASKQGCPSGSPHVAAPRVQTTTPHGPQPHHQRSSTLL